MRAGILTLQEADNYGAVLQAYALQKALSRLDVEGEFIIFKQETTGGQKEDDSFDKSRNFARQLREKAQIRSHLFDDFRRKYLNYAVSVSGQKTNELNDKYDFFLVGSDQVWNFTIPNVDGRYFLPFAAADKRFSYAASFGGSEIPAQVKDWCARQLNDFHKISVREKQGQKIVKELTGRDSVICTDPVFLLERVEWEKLTRETNDAPYLLLYLIQYNKDVIDYANRLAEKRKVKVRIVTASFMYACGINAWNGTGVTEWLSLIRNADSVVTDSFHGCAFSMIFGRPLVAGCLMDDLIRRNGRIEELLERVGLQECMNGKVLRITEDKFSEYMNSAVKESYDYLRKIVESID